MARIGDSGECRRTCDDKRNLHRVHRAGEALIVMCVAGEDRMRPRCCRRAGAIDVRQHQWALAALRAPGERRMMRRDNHRTGKVVALHSFQRRRQKRYLAVIEHRILPVFTGYRSRILEHVAVKPQDANEWCFKRKVHSGLNHRGAQQTAGVRRRLRCCGTKILQKGSQSWCRILWIDDAIVIACDSENRRRIIAVWFVKLIEVVGRLAKE